MAADRQSPQAIREWLVRLGHLCFDDFLLVEPETLDLGYWAPGIQTDWILALNNAPHVALHFRHRGAVLASSFCSSAPDVAPIIENVVAARQRLVTHFACDLLRAKAPPLYDALPWHDWDFSIVTRRFRLWQTRFLLAGDGTTVTMCRCRMSAGVYVVEQCETIAGYLERKASLEKVRRFKLLRAGLDHVPLPDRSADLAVVGSVREGTASFALGELTRVAENVLLIENSPLTQPLNEEPLAAAGFRPGAVDVSGLGQRRYWWRFAADRLPA